MDLTAVIIDDESLSIKNIEIIVTDFCPSVRVVGKTQMPIEGVKLINENKPDIVFLDVEMPGMNGFDVLDAIPNKQFDIIFVTAYDNYAIKAFKVNAIDYIQKPVNIKEVVNAVNKVIEKKATQQHNIEDYRRIFEDLTRLRNQKINIPTSEGITRLDKSEIIHIQADGRYSRLFLNNNESLFVTKTLKELEEIINSETFFRVHKSHLVNTDYIKKYNISSSHQLELSNGKVVDISRRKRDDFLQFMVNYSK